MNQLKIARLELVIMDEGGELHNLVAKEGWGEAGKKGREIRHMTIDALFDGVPLSKSCLGAVTEYKGLSFPPNEVKFDEVQD